MLRQRRRRRRPVDLLLLLSRLLLRFDLGVFPPPLLPPPLARHRGRATLVLDLDHTLVRSVALPAGAPLAKGSEACAGPGGPRAPTRTAFARRPHLATFLALAASSFEVGVFTAGSRAYAEPVLDALDPRGELFAWRLYRDACVRVPVATGSSPSPGSSPNGTPSATPPPAAASAASVFVVKDLKRLGRPLSRTLLVDNSPTCYAYQVSNGVPVRSWKGGHRDFNLDLDCKNDGDGRSDNSSSPLRLFDPEDDDTALLDLLPLLERAASASDVRPLIEAAFPAAAAARAAARAHPSLFACFEEDEGAKERSSVSAFAAACAKTAAAEEEEAAAAAEDASSDESDATGLAGRRRATTETTENDSNLDLLLAAVTSESESDEEMEKPRPCLPLTRSEGSNASKKTERGRPRLCAWSSSGNLRPSAAELGGKKEVPSPCLFTRFLLSLSPRPRMRTCYFMGQLFRKRPFVTVKNQRQ